MALAGVPYTIGREPQLLANPPDDPAQLAQQEDHAGTPRYGIPFGGLRRSLSRARAIRRAAPSPYVEPRPERLSDRRRRRRPRHGLHVSALRHRRSVEPHSVHGAARLRPRAVRGFGARRSGARATTAPISRSACSIPAATVASTNRTYYKYDLNGGSTFSIDMTAPDMNQAYVEGDEATRERIRAAYRSYIQGLLYFWQTDPRYGGLNAKSRASATAWTSSRTAAIGRISSTCESHAECSAST